MVSCDRSGSRDAAAMEAGERIEQRFVLESVAGRGGMGEVWRAPDEKTGLLCAVKVIRGAPEMGPRFLREAEVLAALNHAHVVRYVHHGVHGDQPYLVMEWLEGEDLGDRLRRGRLPMGTALRRQFLAATPARRQTLSASS